MAKTTNNKTAPKAPSLDNDEPLREFWDRELSRCERAWSAGSVPAIVDALILCHREQHPIPQWLATGAVNLIAMLFRGESLKRRGRLGKATTRYHSHMKDFVRWDTVRELRDRKRDVIRHIKEDLSQAERVRRKDFAQLAHSYTLDAIFEAAAEMLRDMNSPAKGSTSAVTRSYKTVERNMRNGKGWGLYFLPSYRNPLKRLY